MLTNVPIILAKMEQGVRTRLEVTRVRVTVDSVERTAIGVRQKNQSKFRLAEINSLKTLN